MPQPDCLVKATSRKKPAVRKRHTRDQTAAESLKKLATRTVDTFPGPEGSHPWPSRVRWQTPEEGQENSEAGAQNRESRREAEGGTQFTCFAGTKVQILPQKTRLRLSTSCSGRSQAMRQLATRCRSALKHKNKKQPVSQ